MKKQIALLIVLLAAALASVLLSTSLSNPISAAVTGNVSIEVLEGPRAPIEVSLRGGTGGFEIEKAFAVSKAPILSINVRLIDGFNAALPGGYVLARVNLALAYDLQEQKDVMLAYYIIDDKKNQMLVDEELITLETEASLIRKFQTSNDASPGPYKLRVAATFKDAAAEDSDAFRVISSQVTPTAQFFAGAPDANLAIVITVIIALFALVILVYQHLKKDKIIGGFLEDYRKYYLGKTTPSSADKDTRTPAPKQPKPRRAGLPRKVGQARRP